MKTNKSEVFSNDYIGESCIKINHKSGLTIYVVKKPFASAYAIFGTRYGSYDNVFRFSDEKEFCQVPAGIAHFLEHKMFESEDGHDTFSDFAELGADANAYTSTDRTAYLFSCTDEFYSSLRVLIKMVITPVFTKENVAKEQGIIGQEIKMCEDRPTDALHYNLMKALFKENPVRIPIAGTIDSIAMITPELLYKCYDSFYAMSNMALCICGDVDENKILEIADELLPIKEQKKLVSYKYDEPNECNEKSISVKMEVARPLFSIGIKNADLKADESFASAVLCEAIFGQASDFFTELYEEGILSYSYSAYSESARPAAYISVSGDSDSPDEVFERFVSYCDGIAEKGVPDDAFERAKRVLYASVVKNFNKSSEIAECMFEAFLVGENFLEEAEKYSRVTYGEVNALAKRILSKERYAISTVYPKNK